MRQRLFAMVAAVLLVLSAASATVASHATPPSHAQQNPAADAYWERSLHHT